MQIEYEHEIERRAALARLIGVEDRVYLQVDGHARVYAIADEDLDRDTAETSAVHFGRFETDAPMRAALRGGRHSRSVAITGLRCRRSATRT